MSMQCSTKNELRKLTAVIYDGKSIAADTLYIERKWNIAGYQTKLFKWSRGIFATSGKAREGDLFKQWLETDGYKFEPSNDFEGIYTEDGKVYYITNELIPEPATVPTGIGTGGEACEVLVRAGFSGKDAIKEVKKWNVSVGGKIEVFKLD